MSWRKLTLAGVSFALAGCGGADPASLLGTYRSAGKCAGEILTLTSGGKFMHTYGDTTYEGTWSADNRSIEFAPFRAWSEAAADRDEVGGAKASFERMLGGEIRIGVAKDCSFAKK